jgi:hypothetical protein
MDNFVYGIDARDVWVFDGQNFTGLGNQRVKNWLFDQIDPAHYNMVFVQANTEKNQIEIYYPDNSAINGVPNKMLSYRYDLECWNPPRVVTNAISACESPIYVSGVPKFSSRTITYANYIDQGVGSYPYGTLIQKDQGYTYANNAAITSYFLRDNIKLLPNYSGKLMIHRVLPESVNLGGVPFSGTYNIPITPSTGAISVKIEGAESVGSLPIETTSVQMNLDTYKTV